ncbi:predicted protein [Histoplasma capsulatum H143]|uniref:Uncharacterized protein n=1 Tax=Ajellomyces capsulatus (strain H143) TaxID=544712 RepID=C6HEW9_AJECH|nr:predicted protein [Histoplasma capsulatum H143]
MQCSANQQVPSAPSRRREFETRRRRWLRTRERLLTRYARPLEIPLFLNLHDEKLNKLKTLCPIGEFLLRSTIANHEDQCQTWRPRLAPSFGFLFFAVAQPKHRDVSC